MTISGMSSNCCGLFYTCYHAEAGYIPVPKRGSFSQPFRKRDLLLNLATAFIV